MPAMIFKGPCPTCGAERKLIEFKAEPCTPGPDSPPSEYGFRCLVCKTIFPEARDATGRAHRWVDGRHVELSA